jgi:Tetratricopeptide repeat/MYND finger
MSRYEQALPLFHEALVLFQRTLPPEHPYVATSMKDISDTYRALGRHRDADNVPQVAPGDNRICAYSKCKVPLIEDELLSCGGCRQVCYCCRECQVRGWKAHKKACKEAKAKAKAKAAAAWDAEREVVEVVGEQVPTERVEGTETSSSATDVDVDQGGVRVVRCASSQCGLSLDASTRMMCSGCRRVCYCSKACQLVDWKAGHKKACKQSLSQKEK